MRAGGPPDVHGDGHSMDPAEIHGASMRAARCAAASGGRPSCCMRFTCLARGGQAAGPGAPPRGPGRCAPGLRRRHAGLRPCQDAVRTPRHEPPAGRCARQLDLGPAVDHQQRKLRRPAALPDRLGGFSPGGDAPVAKPRADRSRWRCPRGRPADRRGPAAGRAIRAAGRRRARTRPCLPNRWTGR